MSSAQGSRWGSLLSGAVAGLESRLDTILADDNQASAKSRAADAAVKPNALQVEPPASRTSSTVRSRPNSRLQDRLARAVQQRGDSPRASSDQSRPDSPSLKGQTPAGDTSRASMDSKGPEAPTTSEKGEAVKEAASEADERPSSEATPALSPSTSAVPEQPLNTAAATTIPAIITPSPRQSLESTSRPSMEAATPAEPDSTERSPKDLAAELSALEKTHEETVRENREEINSHLERIDALQSKLAYLAQQLASSAKAASTDSAQGSAEKKLAEKDAQIAALMEEGQKLSKTEMKHMTAIKKMRAKAQETDKDMQSIKQRLAKAEKNETEQSERAKRAEAAEKAAQEKLKIVGKIEKDIEAIRAEREEAGLTITELRRQLSEAVSRAEDAEKRSQAGALEAEKRATASLKEDIENLRIEKKLAEDRSKRELQEAKEETTRQREKANVAEMELRGEIANLETKLELLRSRSEEVSSSVTGDSQAKLLRQIETLQTQYAVASENWQGIEGTLTSRVAALEKERDETAKRETDIRKKAREFNSKARKLEDELESISERARTLEQDLSEQRTSAQKLQLRLAQAEEAAEDARAELDKEKKVLEAEFQRRLEEEKNKWRAEMQSQFSAADSNLLRANSPSPSNRRHSPDPLGINRRALPRSTSTDLPLTPMDRMFFDDRRPSARSKPSYAGVRSPEIGTPHRQDSFASSLSQLNGSNTPSIHAPDQDDAFDTHSSPQRTINDMISVSTAAAGPSVQLVERMSATVRRLESERATNKEELARLVAQRDEARESVVALMREVEEKRALDEKVGKLEKELAEMNERYETTLEMLGEKSERVEELESDVADLKNIYRDLVQTMR
ncbi:hypothetical protein M011DRAFT_404304 [Sporormia fimetaria CBS 119925]|uniref:TATA element modulatory factor 1 TATA binding domain-containing protein n=1 Tax=Sporormia fimetaria CBS 119925 TaxID=1340428 RepID=A0A6A6V988_9PLEO|nr:hypothetical protein M011DRAFT_404304 [Sporormia fimetaria CBS 119925]